jgi:hypothetical protein
MMLNGGVLPSAASANKPSAANSNGGGKPGETLQERFARFRKERQRERKLAKFVSAQQAPTGPAGCPGGAGARDQTFRDALRLKFVETCKQYIGIPYHARYHTDPDSEHFNAPLYLDCCGLVRRALQDLQADFGFKIGRWNQNYQVCHRERRKLFSVGGVGGLFEEAVTFSPPTCRQCSHSLSLHHHHHHPFLTLFLFPHVIVVFFHQFDTLPEALTFEELKPGDLVFVEGTYSNPNSKEQKYKLVHIEVFLGGGSKGESTLGARRQRGVVEVHDSYAFKSKSYEITNYYFR